jgi:hypothetical protein
MEFFDDIHQNMGHMLSDEQKADLKQMGERFYGSIDMDKYRPRLTSESSNELLPDQDVLRRIRFLQLQRALESGLQEDDLSEDERELVREFAENEDIQER